MLVVLLLCGVTPIKAQTEDSLQHASYSFLEGVRQQERGHLSAAFDLYNRALELNPKGAETYYKLAGYYFHLKDTTSTREYFAKAAELNPDNPAYQEKLGQISAASKDYPKAIVAFERLYNTSKTRQDILQMLLQLYALTNNYTMMIDVLNRMEVLNGSSEQISLSKMQIYEQAGDKKKEYEELKTLVDNHPLELNYKLMMGNWLLKKGKKKEALKLYNEVLKEDEENAAAKLSLLDYYKATNDQKAIDHLTSELLRSSKTEFDTKLTIIHQNIATYQSANIKDSNKIFRLFNEALSAPQENADILMLKAAFMNMLKMPADSLNKVYIAALKVEPENISARINLIQNVWIGQDFDRVIELCKPALLYNPEEIAFYYFQGFAQFQKHQNDAALETFKKGVSKITSESNPDIVSDFYAIMGDIFHEKGLDTEAFAAYDSCLQWKPENYPALNNYAYYLSLHNKDLPRAEQMSYKTVKAEPKNSTYLDTYAWILFQEKRYEEAKIYMEQVLLYDKSPDKTILEHAGDVHAMVGDMEKAIGYWRKSLEKGNTSEVLKKKLQIRKYIAE